MVCVQGNPPRVCWVGAGARGWGGPWQGHWVLRVTEVWYQVAAGHLVRQGDPNIVSFHLLCVHVSDWGAELALMLGGPLERAGNWGLGGLGVASRLHSAGALGALPFAPW